MKKEKIGYYLFNWGFVYGVLQFVTFILCALLSMFGEEI